MSETNYIASNWRTPENSNSSKNDNYSLDFNGSSDFISCGNDPQIQLTGDISISAWFKTTSTGTMIVAAKRDSPLGGNTYGWQLYCSGGVVRFLVTRSGPTSTSINGTTNIADGAWHHVLCTINQDSQIAVILDGQTEGTASLPAGTFIDSNTDLRIGYNQVGSQHYYFNGEISEVALFDYLASGATLYGNATSGSENPMALKPTPVGYWPLGDNSASDPLAQPNVAVEDASVFDFNNASSQHITLSTSSSFQIQTQTISMWVKPELNTRDPLFLNGHTAVGNVGFEVYQDFGNIRVRINGSSQIIGAVNIGEWNHIFAAYDGDDLKYSVDGATIATYNFAATISYTSYTGLILGNSPYGYYDGEMSNVAFWTSDQSSNYINAYNNGYPQSTYTVTPTAWYKLDQSANWEADTVGAWQIPDAVSEFPQSFDFDGTNDEIDAGDILHNDGQTPITVSAWVNVSTDGDYPIAGKKKIRGAPGYLMQGWDVALDTSGLSKNKLAFALIGATAGSVGIGSIVAKANGFDFNDGLWHHVVVTYDGSEDASGVKFYRDSVEDTNVQILSNSFSGNSPNVPSVDFKVGTKYKYSGSNFYNGKMSNVQIWDVALTGEKVTTLYNGGTPTLTPPNQSDLKAWYKLDNTATFSTNWTVPDASGNANTGTSSGMTEQSLVNNNVSTLNGESSGMTSGNLVLSDLTRNLPYENYSLQFDGTADYIDCGNISGLSGGLTEAAWSGWFNRGGTDAYYLMSTWGTSNPKKQFGVLQSATAMSVYMANSVGSQSTMNQITYSFSVDTWYHLAFVYDESESNNADKMKVYVNGVLQTNNLVGAALTTLNSTTQNFEIGKLGGYTTNEFNGKISNVAIWNNGLSSTEVQNLYANGMPQDLTTFTPQPINWWTLGKESFWDGSDWVIRDMIGTNDGLSDNMGGNELKGEAPRSQANGVGTNIAVPTDLKGEAGWSDKNGYSINMSSTARTTDTP